MRLHRVLIIGLREALSEALFGEKYADKVIERVLKSNKKWGSKDRAFVAESFYDIIRWKRKLEFYMGGTRVLDVCAGAGGKTLHLASLMKNKGQIIALDLYEWKLKELKRRARRAGAHNIETRPIISKTIKRLKDGADSLLIDAPCSGLGVLKRNPDSKWKLDQAFIDRITDEQAEILQNYSKVLRKSGRMVYATCSILKEENEQQVAKFLENNEEFELINQETLLPHQTGNDGFFIAVMERKA